jgi:hypothetical protein
MIEYKPLRWQSEPAVLKPIAFLMAMLLGLGISISYANNTAVTLLFLILALLYLWQLVTVYCLIEIAVRAICADNFTEVERVTFRFRRFLAPSLHNLFELARSNQKQAVVEVLVKAGVKAYWPEGLLPSHEKVVLGMPWYSLLVKSLKTASLFAVFPTALMIPGLQLAQAELSLPVVTNEALVSILFSTYLSVILVLSLCFLAYSRHLSVIKRINPSRIIFVYEAFHCYTLVADNGVRLRVLKIFDDNHQGFIYWILHKGICFQKLSTKVRFRCLAFDCLLNSQSV